MKHGLGTSYVAVAALALLWAVGNSFYVYLALDGARMFRLESAVFILAAVLLPLVLSRPSAVGGSSSLTVADGRLLVTAAFALWLTILAPFLTLPLLSDDYVFLATYRQFSDVLSARVFLPSGLRRRVPPAGENRRRFSRAVPRSLLLVHASSAWLV